MSDFAEQCGAIAGLFFGNFEHGLALLLLVSRLGDVLSTRIATPQLRLEANPLARKLGWPFAWLSLLLCLVPYVPPYGTAMAVPILVISLLASSSNFSRAWSLRALGEQESVAQLHRLLLRSKPWQVHASLAASNLFLGGAGGLLLLFYPEPDEWGFHFAWGIIGYAAIAWFYSSLSIRRHLRQARAAPPAA